MMLALLNIPPEIEALYGALKSLTRDIVAEIKVCGDESVIPSGTDLAKKNQGEYIFIKSGCIKFFQGEKLLRFFSDQDIILTDHHGFLSDCRLFAEYACEVIVFDREVLMKMISKTPALQEKWNRLKEMEILLLGQLCSLYMKEDLIPDIAVRSYGPGEVIVREGDPSTEIYYLVDGRAEAKSGDVPLGAVASGEVFGEMGCLNGTDRAATVVAASQCLVQAFSKPDFLKIIQIKPHLAMELIETLAKRLDQANKKNVTHARL